VGHGLQLNFCELLFHMTLPIPCFIVIHDPPFPHHVPQIFCPMMCLQNTSNWITLRFNLQNAESSAHIHPLPRFPTHPPTFICFLTQGRLICSPDLQVNRSDITYASAQGILFRAHQAERTGGGGPATSGCSWPCWSRRGLAARAAGATECRGHAPAMLASAPCTSEGP